MSQDHEDLHEHEHEHEHITQACDGPGHMHHHHEDGSCCCEQHEKEFHGIDKTMLARLIVSVLLYLAAMLLPLGETAEMIVLICAALLAGYDILWSAVKNLFRARIFDEYFLMSFAAVAAFVIGEYEEAAAVFVLYRIGASCQSYAIRHSRRTISVLAGDGTVPEEAGTAQNRFITRFSKIYTPVILILAVLIALALPLLGKTGWHNAIYRALSFLVLACPCAIVISVPLAYSAGIGVASKRGVWFHDAAAIDALASAKGEPAISKSKDQSGKGICRCELPTQSGACSSLILKAQKDFPLAKAIARKTRLVATENVWFTILVKAAVLILSVFGVSALWIAVFADSGVTVIVVLNALRAFHVRKPKS